MKRIISVAIYLVMIGFSLFQVGCTLSIGEHPSPIYAPLPLESGPPPWAPAHGHRAKHQYYYYPESHVYFDVGRSLYFYSHGAGWQASVSLPSGIRVSAGEYVSLDMDNDRPYIYHADVEKRYPPGQLKKKGKGKNKKWD
ncbi:MAG: hypothetical protein OEW45_16440 [Deltaproteobacteria bacterium]|nr:hypothetical protein [Deltaproteobacteria bacterium]